MVTNTKNQRLPLTHKDIPRYIPGTKLSDAAVKELAAKSKALLDYDTLAEETGIGTESLVTVLARLEIEVLDKVVVEEYKTQKTRPDVGEAQVEDEEDSDEEERDNRQYRWCETNISSFTRPIPERVLAKCVQIKEAAPGVEFRVHYLKRDLDPFIEVRYREERFFFEVWDEPNFSGRVTAEDAKRAGLKSEPTK